MILKLQQPFTSLLIGAVAVFFIASAEELQDRESYSIPLPKISISKDDNTGRCDRVRILFINSDNQIIIGGTDDILIKNSRNSSDKRTFRESPNTAYQISDFEAEQLNKVCKQMILTLEQFEKNLQNKQWAKCLYLDAYLPHFLSGFNNLLCLVSNSSEIIADIPDSLYDISLSSKKTDLRIKNWQTTEEHIVKLRIAAKELIFQTKEWQKKELLDERNEQQTAIDSTFLKSLDLFEKTYFNIDSVKIR